ncbi:hypothetical protein [Streptomyces virginiae]|uniref:hypothetical protein n=1 Tax=Streptomyces virginiae TaxID=1961 RepID=UPI0004CB316F|nr:hypothetical protein [Streptomyces virginiae]
MEIIFRKLPHNRHDLEVRDRRGPDVRLPGQATGPSMPHDLVHAAVESALSITDGFWGAMARGATFEGFEPVVPTRHRRSGMKVLRRGGDAVMRAELCVNWAYRVWSGLSTEGRGVGRSPLDDRQVALACAALDRAAGRWSEVAEGGSLTWRW